MADPPGQSAACPIVLIDNDDEDDDLKRALALSLQEHVASSRHHDGESDDEEDDDELQAALALSMQASSSSASPTGAAAAAAAPMHGVVATHSADDDDALQAALALSLAGRSGHALVSQQRRHHSMSEEEQQEDSKLPAIPNDFNKSAAATRLDLTCTPLPTVDATAIYEKGQPYPLSSSSSSEFDRIMWDTSTITTENDQLRWVQQGMDVRTEMIDAAAAVAANALASSDTTASTTTFTDMERLEPLAKSHLPWGLIQQHGGPCGVLAAVQAEMLKHLLWGPLSSPSYTVHNSAALPEHETQQQQQEELHPATVVEALARALGVILARAAVMPYANEESKTLTTVTPVVQLVLPSDRLGGPLTWNDFNQSSSSTPDSVNDNNSEVADDNNTIHQCRTLMQYPLSLDDLVDEETTLGGGESFFKRLKTGVEHVINNHNVDPMLNQDEVQERLAQTIASFLLQQPPEKTAAVAVLSNPKEEAMSTDTSTTANASSANASPKFVAPIHQFQQPGGVLLLVMCLIATRNRLQEEFDDPIGTKLTAQFGHCSQELMNLLLTGQAVSNVFDYTLRPSGDELICRGISTQPSIGYLSQLESLRYCEVGSFYKSPRYPIWVVGSQSHFTVLWGPRVALNESRSDVLLEKCRRAFKSVDGGDNGFVVTEQLGAVLTQLPIQLDEAQVSLLGAALEVNGAGIVLWDDFWKATSRLLTGASLESVLQKDVGPPPLIKAGDQSDANNSSSNLGFETDEDMARRLQNEWGYPDQPDAILGDTSSVGAITGGSPVNLPSDEDDDQQSSKDDTTPMDIDSSCDRQKMAPSISSKSLASSYDFEKFGNTFPLYHYNGLRGGVLTCFRVTRLSPEEAVGASIALTRGSNNGSGGVSSMDLEDVIRTKWPSCAVNWLGNAPPFID